VQFDVAGSQIKGRRERQEDSFAIAWLGGENAGGLLAIVADGVGGSNRGDVASMLAVRSFKKLFSEQYRLDMSGTLATQKELVVSQPIHLTYGARVTDLLQAALHVANQNIADSIERSPFFAGMACTFVGVFIDRNKLWWISVGDSHLFLLRDRQLHKKNAIHNLGALQDGMGATISIETQHRSRNVLVSAMTGAPIPMIDCPEEPLELQAGDCVILSSDGLNALSPGKISYFCANDETADDCVADLLEAVQAVEIKTQDNATVLVIKCAK
jgi:serine/threonine protein phosphatase PrpC